MSTGKPGGHAHTNRSCGLALSLDCNNIVSRQGFFPCRVSTEASPRAVFSRAAKSDTPGHKILLAVCSFAALAMLLIVGQAVAHAILLQSNPSINSSVPGSTVPIKLRFNVRIDATRSR